MSTSEKLKNVQLNYFQEQLAPILADLESNDSETVANAIKNAEDWLNDGILRGTQPVFVPILLALKRPVDNNQILEKSVVDEARELLVEHLELNRLLAPDTPEMNELYCWYDDQT